jgi:type II secretory pathway component PulJ
MQTPYAMQVVPVLEAIRQNKQGYAVGGAVGMPVAANNNQSSTANIQLQPDPELTAAINQLNNHLSRGIMAKILNTDLEDRDREIERTNQLTRR